MMMNNTFNINEVKERKIQLIIKVVGNGNVLSGVLKNE